MASIDTDYWQVKPRELGPKPSCCRSSLKADPNRTRRFRPHEPSNRFRDRIDDALSDNRSPLVHYADRRLLQRHVQSNIAFHCTSPSLLGPHEAGPSIPGELIPCALVWLDPGITPCCKTRLVSVLAPNFGFWRFRWVGELLTLSTLGGTRAAGAADRSGVQHDPPWSG
jgi:hypothetical protein